jgi:hypothetical protein
MVDVANPRIQGLCAYSPTFLAGFGCGHGTCVENNVTGDYCDCDLGFTRSAYFINVPTCQETTQTRAGILWTLAALGLTIGIVNIPLRTRTRSKIKHAALANSLAGFSTFAFQMSVYLEGYWGVAATIFQSLLMLFLCLATAYVLLAIYEPILKATNLAKRVHNHQYLFLCQAFAVPILESTYIVSLAFAYQNNWDVYNSLACLWNAATFVSAGIIIFLPIHYVVVKFGRLIMSSSNEDKTEEPRDSKRSPSPSQSSPVISSSRVQERNEQILRTLKMVRNAVACGVLLALPLFIFQIATILLYKQIPFQAAVWFVTWFACITLPTGITLFRYGNQTGVSKQNIKHSSQVAGTSILVVASNQQNSKESSQAKVESKF